MVDILLLLSARYATSRAILGTIDMLHPPPAGLLCSLYLNDGSGSIAASCKLVPIEDSSSTFWESFNVEADMAPSYEICAEESLVLSAEKYADARILLFTISMRPRCVGRSRPFRRFISQSQLIGFILQNIQLQVSVGG